MKFRIYLVLFFLALIFYSFRITQVPQGITLDEAAFGYNAVLLSRTAKDENSRTLPVFILSINSKDWRNPIPQYSFAFFYKLFGASLKNLRLVSAIYASLSAVLLYYLVFKIHNHTTGLFAYLLYLSTPIIMIHAHLGLDILTPLPFVILWLIFLLDFLKTKSLKHIFLSAVSLGISFYSYKAARAIVPIWVATTFFFLLQQYFSSKKLSQLKSGFIFLISISPFFLIIPFLEYKYAGAILGGNNLSFNFVSFARSYLSCFDFSFLFVEGDQIIHHTTTKHGMLLFALLPIIVIGIFSKLSRFSKFILINLILGPLLIGLTSSYHRASRLAMLTPLYIYFAALGLSYLYSAKNKTYFYLISIILIINSYLFLNYYWRNYAKDTYHHFYSVEDLQAYQIMYNNSLENNALVYQTVDLAPNDDQFVINNFMQSLYFGKPLSILSDPHNPPNNSLIITHSSTLNFQKIGESAGLFIFSTEK